MDGLAPVRPARVKPIAGSDMKNATSLQITIDQDSEFRMPGTHSRAASVRTADVGHASPSRRLCLVEKTPAWRTYHSIFQTPCSGADAPGRVGPARSIAARVERGELAPVPAQRRGHGDGTGARQPDRRARHGAGRAGRLRIEIAAPACCRRHRREAGRLPPRGGRQARALSRPIAPGRSPLRRHTARTGKHPPTLAAGPPRAVQYAVSPRLARGRAAVQSRQRSGPHRTLRRPSPPRAARRRPQP